jgi:phosphatidate cytidylyltransferase
MDPDVGYTTLLILVGFFVAAGIAVFAYEKLAKTNDLNLRKRYFSWYIIAPVMLLPAYFGGLAFAVLVSVLALYSMREFFDVAHVRETKPYKWIGRICGISMILAAIFASNHVPWPLDYLVVPFQETFGKSPLFGVPFFYMMPVFVIMAVLMIPIWLSSFAGMLMKETVTIFGILYFGWFLGHLIFLRDLNNGFGYLIFLSSAVVLNDVLAYTCGRIWGKRKMAPHISPKKTWEGFAGGLIGSILAAGVFHYAVPDLPWSFTFLAGLLIAVAAPLGDLVVSVIKRDMAVKDSGQLIPGHGGLLDRLDSLILAAPAFYYYLLFIRHFE